MFEDDVPFPKVGYVSSLEGNRAYRIIISFFLVKLGKQTLPSLVANLHLRPSHKAPPTPGLPPHELHATCDVAGVRVPRWLRPPSSAPVPWQQAVSTYPSE